MNLGIQIFFCWIFVKLAGLDTTGLAIAFDIGQLNFITFELCFIIS